MAKKRQRLDIEGELQRIEDSAKGVTAQDREMMIKKLELQIRLEELRAKEQEKQSDSWAKHPLATALIAAFSVMLGSIGTQVLEMQKIKMAKKEFEAELIMKALSTDNPQHSAHNLLFLGQMGFLKFSDDQLKFLRKSSQTPSGSPTAKGNSPDAVDQEGGQ